MRIEIPEFARCCACVPLRYGILTFGYLNLSFTIFLVALEIYVTVVFDSEYSADEILQSSTIYMYRGVGLFSQMWFIMIIYGCEIVFNVILLVGAHMREEGRNRARDLQRRNQIYCLLIFMTSQNAFFQKRSRLIRAYYYYGITTSLAAFVCYVLVSRYSGQWWTFDYYIVEFCFAFAGFVLHVYLLLLIRSELKKLETKRQMCFVNHAAEVYVDLPSGEQGRNPL